MSRSYRVARNSREYTGTVKLWVLSGVRGAKKFQHRVNKCCRRLDKIAIAEGIQEMENDFYDALEFLKEQQEITNGEIEDWENVPWGIGDDEDDFVEEDWDFLDEEYYPEDWDFYDPHP